MTATTVVFVISRNGKPSGANDPWIAKGPSNAMCRRNTADLRVAAQKRDTSDKDVAYRGERAAIFAV